MPTPFPTSSAASRDVDEALSALETMAKELVGNARFIRGIYDTCDRWCMYCPVTERCLAFRTIVRTATADPDALPSDGVIIDLGALPLSAIARAEGRLAPPEVEALLSDDAERQRRTFTLNDPLERLGRSYLLLAEAYLESRHDGRHAIVWRAEGPTPVEVLAWFHVLAPSRVFRAILCANDARDGVPGRTVDMLAAAKAALVFLDRSSAALMAIANEDNDPRVGLLQTRLRGFREAIIARFPDALAYARPGLDVRVPFETRPKAGPLAWWRKWCGIARLRGRP